MINKIIKIFKESKLDDIYLIGIFDDDSREFIVNNNFIYLEIGEYFLEIEAIESYSKLKIEIKKSISEKNFFEDVVDSTIRISEFIFINPLSKRKKIESVYFYNLDNRKNYIITDVLLIKLSSEQYIFIDPQFLGINIGGLEQKRWWEDNLNPQKEVKIIKYDF